MSFQARLPDFKAGDTFAFAGLVPLPPGDWTATCEVRNAYSNALIGTVLVALGASADGQTPIALAATAEQTAQWPLGQHQLDIRLSDAGVVVHSSTVTLPVVLAITGVP